MGLENLKDMKISSIIKNFLSNTFIRNSLVWAAIMISSALVLGEDYKKISFILLIGFFMELIRQSSGQNAKVKADSKEND